MEGEKRGRTQERRVRQVGRDKRKRGNRWGEDVLCPLFVSFSDYEIKCQSHMPDASSTVIKYSNLNYCKTQRSVFCEGCWERCEHYRTWKHFRWEEDEE